MLEGKEFEKNLGEYGHVSVDVTPELYLEIQAGIRVDLIAEIKKLAAKTKTTLDDAFIAQIESMIRKAKEA